ncbi:phosphatase PAP2 family protein [Paenibacillus sp. PR3]|uniref:Phosphatase PAP2 family protein n=1 Tax=Paenibacillus terricola TaxID=2763503 RepID=A0ABR8MTI5_9BACL|nr:phosphatase PAP2 family protein [Paenibacillus terricola]MBD3919269.1 phosphatase PAP2 family protein [Paenibacillus terricola]
MNKVLFRMLSFAFLLLGVFLILALLISRKQIHGFDDRLITLVSRLYSPTSTAVMKGFTFVGSGLCISIITLLIVFMLLIIGYRRELIFYVGIIVGSGLLNLVLKMIFHRARPDIHRIVQASGYSFPSGHSMAAFTFYGITIYFLWKHARYAWLRVTIVTIGIVMILMIGISRIYLGVHYPSDVVGGYVISAAWITASIGSYERFLEKRWQSRKFRSKIVT